MKMNAMKVASQTATEKWAEKSPEKKAGFKVDILQMILILALGGCFLGHVWGQLMKFFKRDTTITSTKRFVDHLRIPTISICAQIAFKYDEMNKMGLDMDQWVLSKNSNSFEVPGSPSMERIQEMWTNSTYDVDELVKDITFVDIDQTKMRFDVKLQNTDQIRISEINNLEQGRCYTINLKVNYREKYQFLTLKFHVTEQMKAINLYIHDEGQETIGIAASYWTNQPFSIQIKGDTRYNFELSRTIEILDANRDCISQGSSNDTHQCIQEQIQSSGCITCQYPFYSPFGPINESLKVCPDMSELHSVRYCFSKVIGRVRVDPCHEPCSLPHYGVLWRSALSQGRPNSEASSYFYYKEVEEEIQEEYLLLDFGAILAAVGGSMGLFLGFSFLDFGLASRTWIRNLWQ